MLGRYVEDPVPLVEIHIGLLAHQIRVTTSDALYLSESVHNLLLAIDVGVEKTEDELKVRLLSCDERCDGSVVFSNPVSRAETTIYKAD